MPLLLELLPYLVVYPPLIWLLIFARLLLEVIGRDEVD
jgi:hypothetical protein